MSKYILKNRYKADVLTWVQA